MKTVQGDLLKLAKQGEFDVIAHGCNCQCVMGAGIAKQIREQFPEAYKADKKTKKGDRNKLGTITEATIGDLTVVNAYTQYHWRGFHNLDYEALRAALRALKARHGGKRIGLPQIGAGLAGGNLTYILKIIQEELDGEDITIVEYKP